MKVDKLELVKAISRLKSVVQKNEKIKALEGILIKDGYLTASNTELTVQVKLEASEGERFIIPMKAFDLIKSLPDGEVNIAADEKYMVKIQTGKIKNSYQSYDPASFRYEITPVEGDGVKLPCEKLMEAIGNVAYAAADKSSNAAMTGIYFDGVENELRVVGLNGCGIALDRIPMGKVTTDIKVIIPKPTIKKLLSLGLNSNIDFLYDKGCAIFKTEECTVYTRTIEGKYFPYEKMFMPFDNIATVNKMPLLEAIERAKLCTDGTEPAIFYISGQELELHIRDSLTDYCENIHLREGPRKAVRIGFNIGLLYEAIKTFPDDEIYIDLNGPKQPVIFNGKGTAQTLLLPVRIKE